eukprot:scaffold7994_cov122-Isochrysis_galbana.AAC.12
MLQSLLASLRAGVRSGSATHQLWNEFCTCSRRLADKSPANPALSRRLAKVDKHLDPRSLPPCRVQSARRGSTWVVGQCGREPRLS